ncbi:MAG TPA: hypothetical protein VN201_00910 [Roseateles sp.]|nr:hypothetical protein [Roseateles sp.]
MPIKPETAVDLVGKYARLTHAIKACKGRIGVELDKCPGLKGKRLERATEYCDWLCVMPGDPTKAAQDDQDTHLKVWYSKDYGEWEDHGYPHFRRFTIGEGDEPEECPACYAAHLIVQERKALRSQLAHVKAAMTRLGA